MILNSNVSEIEDFPFTTIDDFNNLDSLYIDSRMKYIE